MAENENKSVPPENETTSEKKPFNAELIKKIIIFAGIAGIALIFLSNLNFSGSKTESAETVVNEQSAIDEYRADLCDELGNMLASIDGVGKTKIMITMESTTQTVYATEEDTKSRTSSDSSAADTQTDSTKNYIIIREQNGGENGLTITKILPKIKGVLIICEGGDQADIKKNVTDAVSAALGVSSSRICVSKLSS